MSHFQCPVCGKHSSINNYNPEGFDPEVDIIAAKSLGRGHGFSNEVVGELEGYPELMDKLLGRVNEVQRILVEKSLRT